MNTQSELTRAQLFLAAVGEKVLTYRETADLSLVDLSDRTGLSVERIDQIEHGWFDPTLTDLQAIAEAVGTTAYELLDVSGSELGMAFGEAPPET